MRVIGAATPLALAATLIFSAPIARAATLTNGSDPAAITINLNNMAVPATTFSGAVSSGPFLGTVVDFTTPQPVTVSGNTVISSTGLTGFNLTIPVGDTFTDLNFSTAFSGGGAPSTVTVTGSNGTVVSNGVGFNGSNAITFSDTSPLTSVMVAFTPTSRTSSTLGGFGLSDLATPVTPPPPEIPLPASFPLFATGLGALGLLGWRRHRKSSTSFLAA